VDLRTLLGSLKNFDTVGRDTPQTEANSSIVLILLSAMHLTFIVGPAKHRGPDPKHTLLCAS